jgi:hypothetical protein
MGQFVSGLKSKPVAMFFDGLVSKPVVTVFWFGPQNRRLRFDDLGHKINGQFLGLGLKTKQTSVCRLRHKTGGGRSVWGTH